MITAASGFNMPMELVGPELLDFDAAQYTMNSLQKFLLSPSLPPDTGACMIMDNNDFQCSAIGCAGLVGTGGCKKLLAV